MQDRLTIEELLNGINLQRGKHATRNDGVCAMEAAAWMAGEPHSDHPQCVCPAIAAFMRSWNDALSDKDRNRLLKPLVPKVLDTRSTPEVARRRSLLALDWFIRIFTPSWLALIPSLESHAMTLRSLAEIVDDDTASAVAPAVQTANTAVHSVYLAKRLVDPAALLASRTAVDSAACSAAVDSVVDSATSLAASLASRSEAVLASRSAAYLAYLASRTAVDLTVTSLQQSASELVLRMVDVTD